MRDDLRSGTTSTGADDALLSLQKTLCDQLTTGQPLHDAIDALMTAVEEMLPCSICAVLACAPTESATRLTPLMCRQPPDALMNAVAPLDPLRRLDSWLA